MNLRLDDVAGAMEPAQRTLRAEIDQQLDREVAALRQLVDELREAQESDPGEFEALARRVGRLEGTQSSGEASLEARMGALEQRIEQRVAALQDQLGGLGADLETAAEDREQRLALVHARALMLKGRDDWMLNADADSARAAWSGAAARLGPIETLPPELTDAMGRLVRSAERLEGPRTAERVAALERSGRVGSRPGPRRLQPDVSRD
jgi:DNA repair exonuclease SbcCD ATPase subunit